MLIGEVAQRSGISSRMLRHYDRTGVVSPSGRTASGYRHYTEEDLRRLFYAEGLRSLGLSLKEVAAVLDTPDFVPVSLVQQLIDRTRERLRQHEELLGTLERVQSSDPSDWTDVVRTVGLLRGLDAASPSTRHRFALSLSDLADRDVPFLVEAALSEPDPVVAASLRWAVARAGDTAVPLLRQTLASDDAQRRRRAVETLEKIDSTLSAGALAQAFPHDDPFVNRRAALAAGAAGDPRSIMLLVGLIAAGDDDHDVADVLVTLVCDFALDEAVDQAFERALAEATPAGRLRLTSALTEVPGALATERLRVLSHDSDKRVASVARLALEQIADGGESKRRGPRR